MVQHAVPPLPVPEVWLRAEWATVQRPEEIGDGALVSFANLGLSGPALQADWLPATADRPATLLLTLAFTGEVAAAIADRVAARAGVELP